MRLLIFVFYTVYIYLRIKYFKIINKYIIHNFYHQLVINLVNK